MGKKRTSKKIKRSIKREQLRGEQLSKNPEFIKDIEDYKKNYLDAYSDAKAHDIIQNHDYEHPKSIRVGQLAKKWRVKPIVIFLEAMGILIKGQKHISFTDGITIIAPEEEGYITIRIGREATYQDFLDRLPKIWELKKHYCGDPFFKPRKGTLSSNYLERKKMLNKAYNQIRAYYRGERDKGRPPRWIIETMLEPYEIIEKTGCGITTARSVRDVVYSRKKQGKR